MGCPDRPCRGRARARQLARDGFLPGTGDRHTGSTPRHPEDQPRRHRLRGRDRCRAEWRTGPSSWVGFSWSDGQLGVVGASRSALPTAWRAPNWRHYNDIYRTGYNVLAGCRPKGCHQRRPRLTPGVRASADSYHLLANRVSRWSTGAAHPQGGANHTRDSTRCTSLHYCGFSLTSWPPCPAGCRSSHWRVPCSRRASRFHTIEPRRPR